MSRNGSGTYNLPAGNPVVTGTSISSTVQNNTMSDMATALTQSICSDGQTPITNNIPFNNYRIIGLADGIASNDAATFGQIVNSSGLINYTPSFDYTSGLGQFLNYTYGRTLDEDAANVIPVNYQYLPNSVLRQITNTTPGTTDLYAGFVKSFSTLSNYSIPLNPTFGGTSTANTGGTIQLEALNYPTSTTIVVPIYSALRGAYPYLGGQGEAGYFGSRIQNNVSGGPAVRLETASLDGVGFYKNADVQDEAIRIVSQFCQVTNCQIDSHKVAINLSNDVVNDAPVFSYIANNTFLHQNDPTTASIFANSGGIGTSASLAGALIELNNFNVSQAEGYLGACSIKMSPDFPVACTIRTNNFQNYSGASGSANRAALELYMDGGGLVQDNGISSGQSSADMAMGQIGLQIGGGKLNQVIQNRISGWPIGVRLQSTLTGSTIGPNYFAGNTTDILIDSGCSGNLIIVSDPATVITDNSGGLNQIVYTYAPQAEAVSTLTYSTSITPNGALGGTQIINVTNNTNFTINAPSGSPPNGQELTITIVNTTGSAMGTVTWNAVYKKQSTTSPSSANSRVQVFVLEASSTWRQRVVSGDIPN